MNKKRWDLIIIGAGPAGLMAACTAASSGLTAVVIEKKRDITKITRACSAQFVLDEGYEGEKIYLKDKKIIFTKNQFEVPYTGRTINIIHNNAISPNGHKVSFEHTNNQPSAVKFDKGQLLKDLWLSCEKLGVEIRFETFAYSGEDTGDEVKVKVRCHGKQEELSGKKLIVAEGANANLTELFGLNKGRKFFGMPLVVNYTLTNTRGFESNSWNQYYGKAYHPFAEIMVGTSLANEQAVELTVMGSQHFKPDAVFKKLVQDSPLKEQLMHAKVVHKTGCAVRSYAPLAKPYLGNVLAIGDSAAHVEVIVQGALMCGYKAAKAVKDELLGEEGFKAYTNWWKKTFEFNQMAEQELVTFYRTLNVKAAFTDEEIDYLFGLLEGQRLCGDFSQFEVPKNLWRALLNYKEQIKEEQPEIFGKIAPIEALQVQGLL